MTNPNPSKWYTDETVKQLIGRNYDLLPWVGFFTEHLNHAFEKGRQLGKGDADLEWRAKVLEANQRIQALGDRLERSNEKIEEILEHHKDRG